tara:strand:+ start:10160 stop:10441 length:282 start_codon:yes stop_codon:yes gene_type:complete
MGRSKELVLLQNELCKVDSEVFKRKYFPDNVAREVSVRINEILLLSDEDNTKDKIKDDIIRLLEYVVSFRIPYNDKEVVEQGIYKSLNLLTNI